MSSTERKSFKRMAWPVAVSALLLFALVCSPPSVLACTLWSAAGEKVVGGGTLLAKNRDWVPDHQQHLERLIPQHGEYPFIGLVARGTDSPGVKAGVNTHGLTVVSASPPRFLQKNKELQREQGLVRKLLSKCKTVQEALSHRTWFVGPRFLMLADSTEIASIEIGLDGIVRVETTTSGVLFHTNHYVDSDLSHLNRDKPAASSMKRLEKIKGFLTSREKFELNDFIEISRSTDAGPDNSLWRTGSKPTSTRTLATWVVHQPAPAEGILYLKLANPDKKVREYRFKLKDIFSGDAGLSRVNPSTPRPEGPGLPSTRAQAEGLKVHPEPRSLPRP